ncbi:DNA-binding response regulator [Dictyobacter formicarum]|uniref:DNA-binding response regulator n=1 Tax=Dictyobacter formicarum TaxID=2778368 RepID=A0ABQ3VLF1_9CHLR|nr:DNA-binding response regulator [Dictyobacter formicarum]
MVDDETVLLDTISYNLEQSGYQVIRAADGLSALDAARRDIPDLVVLDIMLPGIDGLEVCRQLRRERTTATIPIIMLTAKGEEIDKVVGLEVGADDYITKPFGRRELLARVRALLRRVDYPAQEGGSQYATPVPAKNEQGNIPRRKDLTVGQLSIDQAGRIVTNHGQNVELQPKQFDLLTYLVRNRGTVLTRDQLLHHVWGYDYAGDTRTVDVHIRWLREKLEDEPANPKLIQTVRGVGYVFRG